MLKQKSIINEKKGIIMGYFGMTEFNYNPIKNILILKLASIIDYIVITFVT